jgi:YegS/Rv2252/BmrU family lipid kinase
VTTLVIANPKAGRGRLATQLDVLLAGRDMEMILTGGPGHASELARRAREEGISTVVAAGGDGTIHEVVNGLLSGEGPLPVLGVISGGSGCDYAKTFGIPDDPSEAIEIVASDAPPRIVDAGLVRFEGGERYFCNIAEVGIGAEVVGRARRMPRRLGGAVYFAGFAMTLPVYRRRACDIRMDGARYEGPLTNLVVAIGQVFGGGMRVAPDADPSDGLFDVQVQFGPKRDYVTGIAKVYRGTHIPHPRVREQRATHVEVGCEPAAVIEADGEVLGRTPATFSLLAGALRLKA